eukprot:scpid57409/ scgid16837/ 
MSVATRQRTARMMRIITAKKSVKTLMPNCSHQGREEEEKRHPPRPPLQSVRHGRIVRRDDETVRTRSAALLYRVCRIHRVRLWKGVSLNFIGVSQVVCDGTEVDRAAAKKEDGIVSCCPGSVLSRLLAPVQPSFYATVHAPDLQVSYSPTIQTQVEQNPEAR